MSPYIPPIRFCLQLIAAESIFFAYFPRRKKFFLGLAFIVMVPMATGIGMNYAMASLPDIFRVVLIYPSLFILSLVGIGVMFSTGRKEILFAGVGGYILQHAEYNISRIFLFYFGTEVSVAVEWILFHILPYLILDTAAWLFFVRPMMKKGGLKAKDSRIVLLALGLLIVAVIISGLVQSGDDFISQVVCKLYAIACCIILWFFMFGIFRTGELENDNAILEQCLLKDAERSRVAQQTDEIISFKFHDLKHQLRELKEIDNHELRQKTIEDLEKAITSYSEVARTGCKALDILLGEKLPLCRQNAVKLSYNAEGRLLSFMEFTDVYSFFGNALDNAIESVLREEDKDRRTVSVEVRERQGFVFIGIYNHCREPVKFEGGLPVTDKADQAMHGFGVKSMRYIVEKYGGKLTMTVREKTFCCEAIFSGARITQ